MLTIVPFLVSLTLAAAVSQNPAPVPPRTLARGIQSGIVDARQVTIRRLTEWEDLWAEHSATDERPAVDWERELVVGLFMGRRMTGGFGVEIQGTEVRRETLVVRYRETAPAPGAVTVQMLTSPYHLVAVPIWPGEIAFEAVR